MLKIVNHKYVLSFGLVIIAILIQACAVNLPAVRDYSKATVLASNTFSEIANDLPKSCVRGVEVTFEGKKVTVENNEIAINQDYLDELDTCSSIETSLDGIYDANNVLKQYSEAIGKLASNDVITFTAELNALEKNLKAIKIKDQTPFDNAQAKAIFQLSEFLVRVAAEGYRQRELKQTIDMADPYLPTLVGGLSSIIIDYKLVLEDEKLALELNSVKLKRTLKRTDNKDRKKGINEAIFKNISTIDSINKKQKAADEFIEVLNKIQSTHSNLAQSSKKGLQSTLLINLVKQYVEELIPILNNLRKVYSN